jgi:predicted RNase H-like HicB family nuclease
MLRIEVEREDDGRWIAEIVDLPGVQAYGNTREEAIDRTKALSLRVIADRLEHGEAVPEMGNVFAVQSWANGALPRRVAFWPPYFGLAGR